MRQKALFLFALLTTVWVLSCHKRQAKDSSVDTSSDDEAVTDSILAQGDTLLLDEEVDEEAIPMSVDELFDDFVFRFDQSNRMQRNRICFPLPMMAGTDTVSLTERNEWQHHYLFFQRDFCTALYNYVGQMQMTESTQGKWAVVEQIFLHQREIHQYHFDRDSLGQWFLTSECRLGFDASELGRFLDFYRDFATDSIFQQQHLSGVIRYVTHEEEEDFEPIEGTISPEQWFEFGPELPKDVITNIRYGQTYENPNHMVMEMRGFANGLQVLLKFQKQADVWRLIGLEN